MIGDDDGMVVARREESKSLLEKSPERIETEKKKVTQLRVGISSVSLSKLGKVFESLGLTED